ncbi:hypothetical protein C3L33_19210, partial [Rhododendron williamsianum]
MAKGGKLTKLKSVLKKWNSFSSMLSRTTNGTSIVAAASRSSSSSSDSYNYDTRNNNSNNIITRKNLHPVYVGKSRRRYLVSSEVVENPVFRELVEKSGSGKNVEGGESGVNLVGCEVVMFEHLLWMLENGDPQPESLDNFVEYYSCS